MKYNDDLEMEIEDLKKQLWKLQNGIISQIENISSVLPEIQQSITEIGQKLPEIQSSVNNITDNIIPSLEDKINNSSGGGENWVLVYDRTSTDPAINLGNTRGILGGQSAMENLPDFSKFKRIRFKAHYVSYYKYFYLDVYNEHNVMNFYNNQDVGDNILNICVCLTPKNGKLTFYCPHMTQLYFSSSGVKKFRYDGEYDYSISKIEAIPI